MRIMMTKRRNRESKEKQGNVACRCFCRYEGQFNSLLSIQTATQDSFVLPTVSEFTDLAFRDLILTSDLVLWEPCQDQICQVCSLN